MLYNLRQDTGEILAWDTETWEPISLKRPQERASERWWWRPAQQAALAINDRTGTVAVYRLPTFEEVTAIPVRGNVSQAAVSDDFRSVAIAFQAANLTNNPERVLVWDVVANSQRWLFGETHGKVTHLTFSPDNRILMAACEDGEIGLWSISDGAALPSPTRDFSVRKQDWKPSAWSTPPFFGPDSTRLYLNRGRELKRLEVWEWRTAHLSILHQTPERGVGAFGFSPDGAVLATAWGGESISLFDANDSRLIDTISANGALILSVAFSPSGKWIATSSRDHTAKLWEAKTRLELATLGGNEDQVAAVVFTSDEKSVVTSTYADGKIKVWDLEAVLRGNVLWRTTNTIDGFVLCADERAIATTDKASVIQVRELSGGRLIQSITTGDLSAIGVDVAASPTDHILAWRGSQWLGILDYDSGQTNTFPVSQRNGFCRPAFSSDGRQLAFADAAHISILDVTTRKSHRLVADEGALAMAFSQDGKLLATTHADGTVTLWDCARGQAIVTNLLAHVPVALDAQFSPNGRLLATGGWDGTAKLWESGPAGLKLRQALRGHMFSVALIFSPDGRRLVTSSTADNTLRLWDTQTGLEVGALSGHRTSIVGFAFSRDGNTLYSAAKDGEVRAWRAPLVPGGRAALKENKDRP
jgi:WD40 repeat protein